MVQMPQRRDRSFAAKVGAFNAGYERVKDLDYEILGNLDADLSFDADHFEFLLSKFSEDANLGVAGTVFKEEGYSSERHSFEGHNHVAGQCQMFRKQCWEEIGGFIAKRGWRSRLDGSHDRPDDGLEDRIVPGEVILSLPAPGNRRTQCPLLFVFLRRERLLPRWASGLGTIPSCLPGRETALYHREAWP